MGSTNPRRSNKLRDSNAPTIEPIVRAVKHPFERLLGLGILLTIGYQSLINIAVVTGAAPTKGIALPLLSNGGTGWVLTAFSIGLLVSMDRRLAREENEVRTETVNADALDNEHDDHAYTAAPA